MVKNAATASVLLVLTCAGLAQLAPTIALPASAPESTPVHRSARPYRPPVTVPSAAGQIRSPTLTVPSVSVIPAARPTFAAGCDGNGCWGSDGTRYNAVGGSLVRPDGRMCQNVGGVMQCQ